MHRPRPADETPGSSSTSASAGNGRNRHSPTARRSLSTTSRPARSRLHTRLAAEHCSISAWALASGRASVSGSRTPPLRTTTTRPSACECRIRSSSASRERRPRLRLISSTLRTRSICSSCGSIPLTRQVRARGDGRTVVLYGAADSGDASGHRRTSPIRRRYNNVTITTVTLTDVKDSPVGVNVGVDGIYWIHTIRGFGQAMGVDGSDRRRRIPALCGRIARPRSPRWHHARHGAESGRTAGRPWPAPSVLNELMRILMIAPEPFFEPRGTPFSEYHRIRALLDLGHTVDLVTYPFGKDVTLPGLRIFRAARPPFITRVKIGPSPAKLFLDMTLTLTALNRARQGSVRRRAFARRRCGDRRRDLRRTRHSPSLRHALEPAAAARELCVQPIGGAALDVSAPRTHRHQAIARDHRHLPAPRGDGAQGCARSARRAHRKRARVR